MSTERARRWPAASQFHLRAVLLLVVLAACAAPRIERPAALRPVLVPFDYQPPRREPARPALFRLTMPPESVLPVAAETLRERGFAVERVDPRRGLLVVRYSGDPEPWVDCGTLRVRDGGELRAYPAAAASLRADRVLDGSWQLVRNLRLDARVVASLRNGGGGTAGVRATYVLTKLVDQVDADGRVLASTRETMMFETGGVGRFRKGTRCVATGRLEEEVARALTGVAS